MQFVNRFAIGMLVVAAAVSALAQDGPDVGASAPAQTAADVLRDFAGADCAFLAAGLLNKTFDKKNLATLIQYPTDPIVVLNLTGSEIKQALERSVALYPQPNENFLQLSGIDATFSKSAPPLRRILSVTVDGTKLDEKRTYSVAMQGSLSRGDLGYFKIWDTSKIGKTISNATVESVLKGKEAIDSPPRWLAVG